MDIPINRIKVKILNCQAVAEAEKNMVFAARLTQRGHRIATMDDLMAPYEKSFSEDAVSAISGLPHPTVQKFAVFIATVKTGNDFENHNRFSKPLYSNLGKVCTKALYRVLPEGKGVKGGGFHVTSASG